MTTVNVEEIEAHFREFLTRVKHGEPILMVDSEDESVTQMTLITPPKAKALRPYGLHAGKIKAADDFDAPLPEEILAAFEGRD